MTNPTTIPLLSELAKKLERHRLLVATNVSDKTKMLAELDLVDEIIALYDNPHETRQYLRDELGWSAEDDSFSPAWYINDRIDE